ncbi:MAG: tRNA pseudouridine(13) synthase TruD [Bdellovibrionales bacterium]|jgi:tRNA pseudouridine13 synthase|nr:tRNA pseudouridine(13) synthase TruD [Bdellovibrionales bacterium]
MQYKRVTEKPVINGKIKSSPEHFIVNEIPLYPLSGKGEHHYYTLTKINMGTEEAIRALSKRFEISIRDIGYAGRKDKVASTTQQLSLPSKVEEFETNELSLKYLGAHDNKIRLGHLKGNEFDIKVKTSEKIELEHINEIKKYILDFGMPNYFGDQRFSKNNFIIGERIFNGEKMKFSKSKRLFYLSVFQSYVFNVWLEKRVQTNSLINPIEGDLTLLNGSVVSGPIFGTKMKHPTGKALELEDLIRNEFKITDEKLESNKLKGNRRAARVLLDDIQIGLWEEGLSFKFFLPKGSYATTLLREFMNIE